MNRLSDKLFISPQLSAADIAAAPAAGITTIINNRPDGEELGQPSAEANAAIAAAKGLSYTHIPVRPGAIEERDVRSFQHALAEADGLVLAHCKTGTRSATLYAIGEVLDGRMRQSDIAALEAKAGLDLSGARSWLASHGH